MKIFHKNTEFTPISHSIINDITVNDTRGGSFVQTKSFSILVYSTSDFPKTDIDDWKLERETGSVLLRFVESHKTGDYICGVFTSRDA